MDTVPVWVLKVALGALGTLTVILIGIVIKHIEKDTKIHELVIAMKSDLDKLDREIYRSDGVLERLHNHGSRLQELFTRIHIRDKQK